MKKILLLTILSSSLVIFTGCTGRLYNRNSDILEKNSQSSSSDQVAPVKNKVAVISTSTPEKQLEQVINGYNDDEIIKYANSVTSSVNIKNADDARRIVRDQAAISLRQAASRARDVKRVEDIKQMQIALSGYYKNMSQYPLFLSNIVGIDVVGGPYLPSVPKNPLPFDGACINENQIDYKYTMIGKGEGYKIEFCLDNKTQDFFAGPNFVTSQKSN